MVQLQKLQYSNISETELFGTEVQGVNTGPRSSFEFNNSPIAHVTLVNWEVRRHISKC